MSILIGGNTTIDDSRNFLLTDLLTTSSTFGSTANEIFNGRSRSWVNFNGSGTVAIRKSYNVDSITDSGTGQYVLNLTSGVFTDANYSICGAAGRDGVDGDTGVCAPVNNEYTTTTCKVYTCYGGSSGAFDAQHISLCLFSDN